jgi:hypothetical protein
MSIRSHICQARSFVGFLLPVKNPVFPEQAVLLGNFLSSVTQRVELTAG